MKLRYSVSSHPGILIFALLLLRLPSFADQASSMESELERVEHLNTRVLELRGQGQSRAAIPLAEESLEIQRRLFQEDNPNVVRAWTDLAVLHSDVGNWVKARELLTEAVRLLERTSDDSAEKAATFMSLGSILVKLGEPETGVAYLIEASAVADRLYGADHPQARQFRSSLGMAQMISGELDSGLANLESSVESDGDETLKDANILNNLGGYYLEAGELEKARSYFERALRIIERLRGPMDRTAVLPILNLGGICWEFGDVVCARDRFQRALDLQVKIAGGFTPQLIDPLLNLAKAETAIGQPSRAISQLRRALSITESTLPERHPRHIVANMKLGLAFFKRRQYKEARAHWSRAASLVEATHGSDSESFATMVANLALVDWASDRYEAARRGFERSLALAALSPAESAGLLAIWVRLELDAGHLDLASDRLAQAEEMLDGATEIDPVVPVQIVNLSAAIRLALGQLDGARAQVELARQLARRTLPPAHPQAIRSLALLRELAEAEGSSNSAEALEAEIESLVEPLLEGLVAIGDLDSTHHLLEVQKSGERREASSVRSPASPLLHRHRAMWAYLMLHPPDRLDKDAWIARVAELAEQMKLVEQTRTGEDFRPPAPQHEDTHPAPASAPSDLNVVHPESTAGSTVSKDPTVPADRSAQAIRDLGDRVAVLYQQGRWNEARLLAYSTVARAERDLGPDHLQTGVSLNNLAAALLATGDLTEARPLLERSLAIHEQQLAIDHPWTLQVRSHLGACLAALGQLDSAETILRRGLALIDRKVGTDEAVIGAMAFELGVTLGLRGQLEEAIGLIQRAMNSWFVSIGTENPQMARAHQQLGIFLQKQGDPATALHHLELALALGQTRETIETHLHLGNLHEAEQRWTEARRSYEEALASARNVFGSQHGKTAECLTHLGNLEAFVGPPRIAFEFLERALQIHLEVSGEDHPVTASSHNNLGIALARLGDHGEALRHFERALAIHRFTRRSDNSDLAPLLINLGTSAAAMGELEVSERYLDEALSSRNGVPRATIARLWNAVGSLRLAQDELSAAKAAFDRALELYGTLGLTRSLVAAEVLNNLSTVASQRADWDAARTYLEEALLLVEQALGTEHSQAASVRMNLAILASKQGDLALALSLAEQAAPILVKDLGRDHPVSAQGIMALGEIYLRLGEYEGAQSFLEHGHRALERVYGPDHLETANGLSILGDLWMNLGKYELAESSLRRVLAIQENRLGPDHPEVAQARGQIGILAMQQGDAVRAEPLLTESLAMLEVAYGPDHLTTSEARYSLALAQLSLGKKEDARLGLARARESLEQLLGADHPFVLKDVKLQLDLAQAAGRFDEMARLGHRALRLKERYLEMLESLVTEERQRDYLTLVDGGMTDRLIDASVHSNDEENTLAAFHALLRHKGRTLATMLRIRQKLRGRNDVGLDHLFRELKSLQGSRLSFSRREAFPGATDAELLVCQQQIVDRICEVRSELVSRAESAEATTIVLDTEVIRQGLSDSSALIEYAVYRRRSEAGRSVLHGMAYVLNASGPPRGIDLGPYEVISEAVGSFLESLRDPRRPYRESARRLYGLTVARLRPLLNSDVNELVIAPDGVLLLVPFSALLDEDGRFLVEQFTIRYASTGRDLVTTPAVAPREPALILGNPHFDTALSGAPSRAEAERSADMETLFFAPLRGAESEARTIAKLLGIDDDRLLIGSRATEAALAAVRGPRFLHLATHGFFLKAPEEESSGTADPLLRSGIALAGFNRRSWNRTADDGVLTAAEAALLDLHGTELVVVSACETGIGDIAYGQGVFGLRRAFAMAGAATQILTLWSVADAPTRDLMVSWYEFALSGHGKAEALQLAQLQAIGKTDSWRLEHSEAGGQKPSTVDDSRGVRTGNTEVDPKHPYFWAAFILSGDGGPLRQ